MPNPWRWALLRVRALFGRRTLERDMKEELRAHLEQAEERMVARGMSRSDARNAALREFGNVAAIEEDARDARGMRLIESVIADLRFAFRYFARKPLTTTTIVLVLALGIGANTALFSILQAFTMRPAIGVPDIDAHVRIWALQQKTKGAQWELSKLTYPEVEALADRRETFTDLAAWTSHEVIVQAPERSLVRAMVAEFVTPNYWRTLGVSPIAGPGFGNPDGTPDMAAVISYALAEEIFEDPVKAVGERIIVNDLPVRIVGVTAPLFEGAIPENGRPQMWIPLSARTTVTRSSPLSMNNPSFTAFGRIAPSVTHKQATIVARDVVARSLADSVARGGAVRSAEVKSLRSPPPMTTLGEDLIGFAAIGVVGLLILLVACTNVSSLLVASAVGRRHEIAVRLSLGASRARVLRQLLTESALLSILGATLGLAVCWAITTIVSKRESVDIVPDAVTVAFTLVIAIGTGMLFGLSPALHATRTGVASALKDSATSVSRQSRLQRVFVVSQIVFSQPLLVMIAVLLGAIIYDRPEMPQSVLERTITARFRPLLEVGPDGKRPDPVGALARQLATEPSVEMVIPEPAGFAVATITIPSTTGDTARKASFLLEGTAPGYFHVQDMAIVLGRDVALEDTAASDWPVVIGSDFARRHFGSENPVGKTFTATAGWENGVIDSSAVTVVGVYDASLTTKRGKTPSVFTARKQVWARNRLLIRTRGPASAYMPQLRKFIQANAPSLPVTFLATLQDYEKEEKRENFQMMAATTAAGALALSLASIGLFAVISLAVGQRKREIGIRIALGAEPLRVARMFFMSGMRMSALGLLIGLPITVFAVDLALKQGIMIAPLFSMAGVGFGIAAVVLAVAAVSTWFPARKATAVDPALALKAE